MSGYLVGDLVVDAEGWLYKRIDDDSTPRPWLRMIGPEQMDAVDAKSVRADEIVAPVRLIFAAHRYRFVDDRHNPFRYCPNCSRVCTSGATT